MDHVVNTVLVYVWNVRLYALDSQSATRGRLGWVMGGDSSQCELWLNCGRECTERLETVGVKKLSQSSISHTSPTIVWFSDVPLCIVDVQ